MLANKRKKYECKQRGKDPHIANPCQDTRGLFFFFFGLSIMQHHSRG